MVVTHCLEIVNQYHCSLHLLQAISLYSVQGFLLSFAMSSNIASRRAISSRSALSANTDVWLALAQEESLASKSPPVSASSSRHRSTGSDDIWLALAKESSSTRRAKVVSATAPVTHRADTTARRTQQAVSDARRTLSRIDETLLRHKTARLERERGLTRARPTQTGTQVKQRFTSDHDGSAVPAAAQRSVRKSFPAPSKFSKAMC